MLSSPDVEYFVNNVKDNTGLVKDLCIRETVFIQKILLEAKKVKLTVLATYINSANKTAYMDKIYLAKLKIIGTIDILNQEVFDIMRHILLSDLCKKCEGIVAAKFDTDDYVFLTGVKGTSSRGCNCSSILPYPFRFIRLVAP